MNPEQPRSDAGQVDEPDIRQTPDGKYQYHDRTGQARGPLHDDRDAAVRYAEQQRRRDPTAPTPTDGGVGGSRER